MLCCVQVVNRDKLQRAGEDNLFVRLLYAKDRPQKPRNQDEQEKLGKQVLNDCTLNQYCCTHCVNRGFVHWLLRHALHKEHKLLESNVPESVPG